MKNLCVFLLAWGALFALLTPGASAQEADAVLVDALTDHLETQEEVRWYSFEMTEPGDAVLIAAGLQEQWDGYTYHWHCTIYGTDQETVIAQDGVRGYSKDYGPAILTAAGLDAGTYYVRMGGVRTANPLMSTFTTDPYQLRLLRHYPSAAVFEPSDQVKTFQNAGEVLWAFDGTAFLKMYDGVCYGALMELGDGAVVPVLIGPEETAVAYVISPTGEIVTAGSPWQCEELDAGRSYYYSSCGYIDPYTEVPVDTASLPMLYLDAAHSSGVRDAATQIAKWLAGPEEPEAPVADDPPEEPATDIPPEEPVTDIQPEAPATDTQPEAPDVLPEEPATGGLPGEPEAVLAAKEDHTLLYAVGSAVLAAVVTAFLCLRKSSGRSGSSSGSSSYGGSYSSSGYGSSFHTSSSERTFTQGGPTGCGIGGSFCGCGSGR